MGLKGKKGVMFRVVVFLMVRRRYAAGRTRGNNVYDYRRKGIRFSNSSGSLRLRGCGLDT